MVQITGIDIAVGIAAMWGAVLSTIVFIRQINLSKPNISVGVPGPILIGTIPGTLSDETMIDFTAVNNGTVPVTLSSACIQVKREKGAFFFLPPQNAPQLPYEITQGRSWNTWLPARTIAETLQKKNLKGVVEVRSVFKDQAGNNYKSKYTSFDIEKELD